jgi:hypothetical protein
MSRYTIQKENKKLVYGFDHALGYFYDITNTDEPEDSSKHLVEEKSSFINKMSRNDFAEILITWGANKQHLTALALDQPF